MTIMLGWIRTVFYVSINCPRNIDKTYIKQETVKTSHLSSVAQAKRCIVHGDQSL
jgi:hypothetical protein